MSEKEKHTGVLIWNSVISLMSKRTTILIDGDLDKKIREYQAKIMKKTNLSYSYSKAVNDLLRKVLWLVQKYIFKKNHKIMLIG